MCASSGTMSMWQDIFAVKIEKMHITDLWTLLKDDALQLQACRPGWKEFVHWSPLCLGRFQCSQCFHNWSSAKVHVLFHMYHCPGGGTVWMRIFRQKCRRCPNSRLEDPQFSLDTVETILHNLVIKILQYFYKKPVQPSDLLEVVVDTPVTGPHDRAHCEACELGICSRAPALDAWKSWMDEDEVRMHSSKKHCAVQTPCGFGFLSALICFYLTNLLFTSAFSAASAALAMGPPDGAADLRHCTGNQPLGPVTRQPWEVTAFPTSGMPSLLFLWPAAAL
uniref:3CxxC-type domain-containing protein n=1 Tax=Serinus canaria TaxID=9135 RepID=A0A8C9NLH5_SERCA